MAVLKETEARMKVFDVCRKHGVFGTTYYQCKSEVHAIEALDLKRNRELEAENAQLKRIDSWLVRDNVALNVLNVKKLLRRRGSVNRWVSLSAKAVDA